MGNKKTTDQSRRGFFSLLLGENRKPSAESGEKIKMLTADGKLVEVDKSVFEKVSAGKKASNKEILNWMKNPSKENS
jgi:hypothetical protein